jgi:hypothetical protein
MKAAVLKAFGSPLAVPAPAIGTGEVVVDVIATRVLSYANEVFSGARRKTRRRSIGIEQVTRSRPFHVRKRIQF